MTVNDSASHTFTDDLRVEDHGWTLVETGWDADRAVTVGSNFGIGNGYLGYRATSPEQGAEDYVALVVTDTYDCADGRWRELANAPNPLKTVIAVDGVPLSVASADAVDTRLHLRDGRFSQTQVHAVGDATITVTVERIASYETLALLTQRVTLHSTTAVRVAARCEIDGDVWDLNGPHLPAVHHARTGDVLTAEAATSESHIGIAVASAHTATASGGAAPALTVEEHARTITVDLAADATLTLDTFASVRTTSDLPDPGAAAVADVRTASESGWDAVRTANAAAWEPIWDVADIRIHGSPLDDAALRFSTFHNRIHTPAHSDHLPVGARGLSCQAYQGAAFWDQEVYNLPAFLFTEPDIARNLLVYRHRTLDGARRKAARLGYDGAYFAWVSGVTGDELCPDVFFVDVLTGREIRNHFNVWQMHVSPDIALMIQRYVSVTDDRAFLKDHGAEVVFEIARFLRSFVRYDDWGGRYHCIRLLGPDEWHENVDDNAFTNYQTQAALAYAVELHAQLAIDNPDALARITDQIGLAEEEVARWAVIRDAMYLPQPDPDTGVIEQFAGFHQLEDVRPDEVRERLIDPGEYWGWPNGVAVRTQVAKQADVAMLIWLHGDRFDVDVARANYAHYEPRCAHGSTLSHAAYGMVAALAGDTEIAYDHFRSTAQIDLMNTSHAVVGGTFIGGIHTAACGGTNQLVVQGFAGLDAVEDTLRLTPTLPAAWSGLDFSVIWRDQRLAVSVTAAGTEVTAATGNDGEVPLVIGGAPLVLQPGQTVTHRD